MSVRQGKFTTKSDVWSFAVTLWEVLTYARQQPYEELTDERVIDALARLYHNDAQQVRPGHGQAPESAQAQSRVLRTQW